MYKITYRTISGSILTAYVEASNEVEARAIFYPTYEGRIISIDKIR